jgi:ABC-type multidrug transport system fused ATPase/permease subunit
MLRGEKVSLSRIAHRTILFQEPVLFNDTIYNNIAMGKAGCTKEEVELAAKQANAYDFIMGLEAGFETMVGVGGGRISGVSIVFFVACLVTVLL